MSYKRPDRPSPGLQRARARRETGGRRKVDGLPRTTLTLKVVAVLVFTVNLFSLLVEFALNRCIEILRHAL